MFAYIKGTLEMKSNDFVVIDVNGVGYKINAPLTTINKLGEGYYMKNVLINIVFKYDKVNKSSLLFAYPSKF